MRNVRQCTPKLPKKVSAWEVDKANDISEASVRSLFALVLTAVDCVSLRCPAFRFNRDISVRQVVEAESRPSKTC